MAVVVTVAKGYDLGYVWKNQGQAVAEQSTGGYYINAAQGGEPPGRWWGPGAAALGLAEGEIVERRPYDAVYKQVNPRTGRSSAGGVAATRSSPTTWPGCGPLSHMPRQGG